MQWMKQEVGNSTLYIPIIIVHLGLKIYADYLAEDHFIGKILMERYSELLNSRLIAIFSK